MNGSYNRSMYSTVGGVHVTYLGQFCLFKNSVGSCFIGLFENCQDCLKIASRDVSCTHNYLNDKVVGAN